MILGLKISPLKFIYNKGFGFWVWGGGACSTSQYPKHKTLVVKPHQYCLNVSSYNYSSGKAIVNRLYFKMKAPCVTRRCIVTLIENSFEIRNV